MECTLYNYYIYTVVFYRTFYRFKAFKRIHTIYVTIGIHNDV